MKIKLKMKSKYVRLNSSYFRILWEDDKTSFMDCENLFLNYNVSFNDNYILIGLFIREFPNMIYNFKENCTQSYYRLYAKIKVKIPRSADYLALPFEGLEFVFHK